MRKPDPLTRRMSGKKAKISILRDVGQVGTWEEGADTEQNWHEHFIV